MSGPIFDTHLVVDWSARSAPSPARPSGDAIWWAAVRDGRAEPPRYARTRAEAVAALADFLAAEIAAGRRVLAGFDFPFGYPQGVAARLTGRAQALALWDWIAARIGDGPDNAHRGFDVAEEINAAYPGVGPAWGRPEGRDHPGIPLRRSERTETNAHPPEQRRADARARTAKPVWQLAYSGAVGMQALVGLPALTRLRQDARLAGRVAVWPLETGLATPDAPVVLAEVYPSLLRAEIRARRQEHGDAVEILDRAQVRVLAAALSGLDAAGGLAPLFAGPTDLSPEDRAAVCAEEAWILGLGAEQALKDGLRAAEALDYERDPKRIYEKSFATVRAEARLERFAPDEADLAIRLIHACGMVDLSDDLRATPGVMAAARAALAGGAPVLCDCEMVASGVIRRGLPAGVEVTTAINDPRVPGLAQTIGNTRSAAAMDVLRARLGGAVVAIGNAPTALFRLMELIDSGAPRPAAILAFPVGFVGAAEAKAALAADPRGIPFATVLGRRGGSAMAAAAVNAAALGLRGDGT